MAGPEVFAHTRALDSYSPRESFELLQFAADAIDRKLRKTEDVLERRFRHLTCTRDDNWRRALHRKFIQAVELAAQSATQAYLVLFEYYLSLRYRCDAEAVIRSDPALISIIGIFLSNLNQEDYLLTTPAEAIRREYKQEAVGLVRGLHNAFSYKLRALAPSLHSLLFTPRQVLRDPRTRELFADAFDALSGDCWCPSLDSPISDLAEAHAVSLLANPTRLVDDYYTLRCVAFPHITTADDVTKAREQRATFTASNSNQERGTQYWRDRHPALRTTEDLWRAAHPPPPVPHVPTGIVEDILAEPDLSSDDSEDNHPRRA